MPRIAANTWQTWASAASTGATNAWASSGRWRPGAGNASRSVFLFGGSGIASSATKCVGTM